MKLSYLVAGMVLTAAAGTAPSSRAASIGDPAGSTAAQAPIGPAYSRYATDDVDEALLASLAGAASGPLVSAGSAIDVRYLGTGAARNATLRFDGSALFDTRSGCDFATALADEFCLIDSIGLTRRIDGLTPGTPISLALDAAAQPLGDASVWRPLAQTFTAVAHAHWLDLGDSRLLLGFEEGSDSSFNDMVFVLNGVTSAAAGPSPVPEAPAAALMTLGLGLLATRRLRRG